MTWGKSWLGWNPSFTNDSISGHGYGLSRAGAAWRKLLYGSMRMPWESMPDLKVFRPKCDNLDILHEYQPGVDFGDDYWKKWRHRPYSVMQGSMVNHSALLDVARELNYPDMNKVHYVVEMLKHGAVLGVENEGRLPSKGLNKESAYLYIW